MVKTTFLVHIEEEDLELIREAADINDRSVSNIFVYATKTYAKDVISNEEVKKNDKQD